MKKRGISEVVVTILLILIVILAVVIVWQAVKKTLEKSTSNIETSCLKLNLEIEKAEINTSSDTLYVSIKRSPGSGNLSAIRFVITNSSINMIRNKNTSMSELETRVFSFSNIGNVSFINKVEIAGIIFYDNKAKLCSISSSKSDFQVYSNTLCAAKTCSELGCGIQNDGCGNQIDCGECPACQKWHPGHYILPTSSTTTQEIRNALSNTNITGLQIGAYWKDLEPEQDVYDFSLIETYLNIAQEYDKQIFFQFMDRSFDDSITPTPDYLNDGYVHFKTGEGYIAKIWEANVMQRSNKLIEEMGRRFNSNHNFEGINFAESSINIDPATLGMTAVQFYTAVGEQMQSRIDNAVAAFPNSTVIQYMNYPGGFVAEMVPYLNTAGAGMGGPDLVPDIGRFPEIERIPAYDYYPIYAGKMPLGAAVQEPNLLIDSLNQKGIFTLDGFWDMGINTLKLNYIFWSHTKGASYKFEFVKDILPYIDNKNGEINSVCPSGDDSESLQINFEPIQTNSLIGTFWTTTNEEVNRLKNIGGSWSKPIFYWRAYENDRTGYLAQFDNYINLIKNSNLQAIITISGGNVPSNQDCLNKTHYLTDGSACTQEEFDAAVENFTQFAERIVSRYKQDVKIFQIMIEPNTAETYKIIFEPEIFGEIMHKTYPRLKAVCPECIIYHGGWAVNPATLPAKQDTWIYKMYNYQKTNYGKVYTDIIAVHPFLNYDMPENNLTDLFNFHKNLGTEFGIVYNDKTYVVADEFAFYTSCLGGGSPTSQYPVGRWPSNPIEAEELQAKYWTRAILLTLSTNYTPRILWPPSTIDSDSTKCCVQAMCNLGGCVDTGCLSAYWNNGGAYFSSGIIKKSGLMVKSLTELLAGYNFSRNLIQGTNGIYAIEFSKDNNKLIAVWSITGNTNVDLSSYFAGNVKITHLITENTEVYSSTSVPISDTPIFVEDI